MPSLFVTLLSCFLPLLTSAPVQPPGHPATPGPPRATLLTIGGTGETLQSAAEMRMAALDSLLGGTDARSLSPGAMRGFLTSPDPEIRTRAAVASGSLQDTLVLPHLIGLLADPAATVREAAAFGIGQTGMMLSPQGKEGLGRLLLPALRDAGPGSRLLEECGKFGSVWLLDTAAAIFPQPAPDERAAFALALARFAIRGVVTRRSTGALLLLCKGEDPPWEAVYALQRAGDHPGVREALPSFLSMVTDPEPLVRLNLAALAGKLRGDTSALILLKRLAKDPDWRVRVNAGRGLASWDPGLPGSTTGSIILLLNDSSDHPALAVLNAIADVRTRPDTGTPGPAEPRLAGAVERLLHHAAPRYSWQRRAAALQALAALRGNASFALLERTVSVPEAGLKSAALRASGISGAPGALSLLLRSVQPGQPKPSCAAMDGVQAWMARQQRVSPRDRRRILERIQKVLSSGHRDVAVATTAAAMLGDSALLDPSSVPVLIRIIGDASLPDDIELLQQATETVGKLGDSSAASALRGLLRSPDPGIASGAAAALTVLTGKPVRPPARQQVPAVPAGRPPAANDSVFLEMRTSRGTVLMALSPRLAPFTVRSMVDLAGRRFFDGLAFHRVVPNFVVQGGDPRGDGWGGPGFTLRSEFSMARYATGTIGIASAGKDTEGSQFFITHSPQPHLDGRYTIIGAVVRGMEIVDRLQVDDRIESLAVIARARSPH